MRVAVLLLAGLALARPAWTPVRSGTARVFVLATDGTDATVRWAPPDPEAGDVIEAFRAHFDERAAQRESYEELDDNSTTIAPSP